MCRDVFRNGFLIAALAALLTSAGCGDTGAVSADAPEAKSLLIDPAQLPEGYRVATGSADMGRPEFCGVAIDPAGVEDFAKRRYTKTIAGPFLYQYVYISPETVNQDLMKRLSAQLEDCSSDTSTNDGEQITYNIKRVRRSSGYGDSSLSFRLTPPQ